MPSNEEITAALRILTHAYDMRTEDDMRELARAMLNAAELIRLTKEMERKLKHPDGGGHAAS